MSQGDSTPDWYLRRLGEIGQLRAASELAELRGRIADLEAALRSLLVATSNQVVMRPSEQEVWREAEAVLLKSKR